MTAREDIIWLLPEGDGAGAIADSILAQHAQELADEARVYFGVGDVPVKTHCQSCDYCAGTLAAIDFINPPPEETS